MRKAGSQCNARETETNSGDPPDQPQQPEYVRVATTQQIRLSIEPCKRTAPRGPKVVEKPVWRAKGLPEVRMSRAQLRAEVVFEGQDDHDANHQCRQGYDQKHVHSVVNKK